MRFTGKKKDAKVHAFITVCRSPTGITEGNPSLLAALSQAYSLPDFDIVFAQEPGDTIQ